MYSNSEPKLYRRVFRSELTKENRHVEIRSIKAYSILFPGSNIKTTIAILNCLLARQFCFEDSSCSAILEIIPRVCGPELGKLLSHISIPNPP